MLLNEDDYSFRLTDCDCCHETFSQYEVIWTGKQFLCKKCAEREFPLDDLQKS